MKQFEVGTKFKTPSGTYEITGVLDVFDPALYILLGATLSGEPAAAKTIRADSLIKKLETEEWKEVK